MHNAAFVTFISPSPLRYHNSNNATWTQRWVAVRNNTFGSHMNDVSQLTIVGVKYLSQSLTTCNWSKASSPWKRADHAPCRVRIRSRGSVPNCTWTVKQYMKYYITAVKVQTREQLIY